MTQQTEKKRDWKRPVLIAGGALLVFALGATAGQDGDLTRADLDDAVEEARAEEGERWEDDLADEYERGYDDGYADGTQDATVEQDLVEEELVEEDDVDWEDDDLFEASFWLTWEESSPADRDAICWLFDTDPERAADDFAAGWGDEHLDKGLLIDLFDEACASR